MQFGKSGAGRPELQDRGDAFEFQKKTETRAHGFCGEAADYKRSPDWAWGYDIASDLFGGKLCCDSLGHCGDSSLENMLQAKSCGSPPFFSNKEVKF